MTKNSIVIKIIVISLINAFLLPKMFWAYQDTSNPTRADCLSPASTISKEHFSRMFDLKMLSAEDLTMGTFANIRDNLFPELNFPEDSNPHRWQHTFEVVRSLNKLMSNNVNYFVDDKLVKEREDKLPAEDGEKEAVLKTYRNNIGKLRDFLGKNQLSDQEREELLVAAVLHDIAFKDKHIDDYSHPEEGARQAAKILKRLSFPQSSIDNICELIKYHDLLGNIIRGKKVAKPLESLSKNRPKLIKKLAILNAMDMAGVVSSKYKKRYNLVPSALDNLISFTDEGALRDKFASDYFFVNRIYMLGRTENGIDLNGHQKKAILKKMMQINGNEVEGFEAAFKENWTEHIEIDDVNLFYMLADIDEEYGLIATVFGGISNMASDLIGKNNKPPFILFADLKEEDLENESYRAALKQIFQEKKAIHLFNISLKPETNRVTIEFLPALVIYSSI